MKKALWLSGVCLLSLWAAQAQATSITSIYNTGVDASHTVLSDGTNPDPHYTLTSVPTGSSTVTLIRTSAGGFPVNHYLGDNASSTWIGPNNAHNLVSPVGNYSYQTTFNLTGFNPSTAVVTGNWATDNVGVNMFLNGNPLFLTSGSFTAFTPFTINSGFNGGVNTLTFLVNNSGTSANATALRVEMSGTASTAVPEPDSLLLLLLGGGLLGVAVWRLKKSA